MRFSSLLCAVSLVGLSACAVGPDFLRPAHPQESSYDSQALPASTGDAKSKNGEPQAFAAGHDIPSEWWTLFQSDPLDQLIAQSIKMNPTLASAQASLRAAGEQSLASEGALFPTATASFDSTRSKTSKAANDGFFPGFIYTLHTAEVSVSYTLDVFGGTRRNIEEVAAQQEYQRFSLEASYLTLTSNVVTTAILEASLRGQIETTNTIIEQESKELGVLRQQFQLGGISKSAVLEQEATLAQSRALLPGLEQQLAVARHELSILAGEFPSHDPVATFTLSNLTLPKELPVSLPSQLVEQRPDIRAAEANLHAASAAIGVAEANRLPQITLSADIGDQVNNLSKLLTPGTGIWSLGANAAQTIFDFGTLGHLQGVAEAQYDVAAANYRSTVLSAFKDVADTLRALQSDTAALDARAEAERAATASRKLAHDQFSAGATTYIDFLNAEQVEQQAKLQLVQAQAQRFTDTAALFQALGGGWWNRTNDIAVPSATVVTTPSVAKTSSPYSVSILPPVGVEDNPPRSTQSWRHE